MPFSDDFVVHRHRGTANHIGPTQTGSTGGGSGSFTLTWNEVFGATDYVVEIGTTSNGTDIMNAAIGSTTPSYNVTGLSAGTYYIRVRSVAAMGGTGTANVGPASSEITRVVS